MNLHRIKDKLNYHKLLNRVCDSIESDAEALIKKQKPELSEDEVSSFVSSLSSFKKPKHKKLAIHWFLQNTIVLPKDHEVVEKAIQFAENKKLDPMSYNDPRELSEQLLDKNIDPDKIPQFTNKKVLKKYNLIIYDVDKSRKGQQAVRDVINAQYGISRNPWCVIQAEDGVLTKESRGFWAKYNKIQRRIALVNGKLIAFSANNSPEETWWDMNDVSHDGVPLPPRKEGDATITEKVNYEGLIVESKEEYAPGYYLLLSYWPNGNLKEESTIKAGIKEGTYKEWHENGQLKMSCTYKNGELHGKRFRWHENGQIKSQSNYEYGAEHGLYQSWYANGQPDATGTYENNKPQGTWKEWYENGQPRMEYSYKNEKKDGKYLVWHENGQLYRSFNYKNGMRHGLCQEWSRNGRLMKETTFIDGESQD